MGGLLCTEEGKFVLANVDFSAISVDPLFVKYLHHTNNEHLQAHYLDVRDSLTPTELSDFDRSLRSTFNSSTVAFGSVGVVALALSLFFDVLATQLTQGKKETTDPIRQIFRDLDNEDSNLGVIISDYLKLVPQIANDQHKMRNVTALYANRLKRALLNHTCDTVSSNNTRLDGLGPFINALFFHSHLCIHLKRMDNQTMFLNCTLFNDIRAHRPDEVCMTYIVSSIRSLVIQFLNLNLTGEETHEHLDMSKCTEFATETAVLSHISIQGYMIGSPFSHDGNNLMIIIWSFPIVVTAMWPSDPLKQRHLPLPQ